MYVQQCKLVLFFFPPLPLNIKHRYVLVELKQSRIKQSVPFLHVFAHTYEKEENGN